jgi:hypothetical protein
MFQLRKHEGMPMGIEVIEYHTPLHIRSQAPPINAKGDVLPLIVYDFGNFI